MNDRLKRFALALAAQGHEVALIARPENIRYLTGYTGEGMLLAGGMQPTILTDFRYVEQAARQAPGCRCVRTSDQKKPPAWVAELMREADARTLAFEADYMTVSAFEALQNALFGLAIKPMGTLIEGLRRVKDQSELDSIARACAIADQAFEQLLPIIAPGMTEREVAIKLEERMRRLGAEAPAFDTIAAAGVNGSLPHAVPSDHVLSKGELLTLDFGARIDGYCSDMTRTVAIGQPEARLIELYDAVLEAHEAALRAVAAGVSGRSLDGIARKLLDARYPGAFGHSLGHGVGLQIHESPRLSQASDDVLEAGHVVTVEPGVYIEGLGGCRIEDTVFVTEDGCIDPIKSPKRLIIL